MYVFPSIWRKIQENRRSLALGNRLEEISFMRRHRSRLKELDGKIQGVRVVMKS